MVGYGYHILCIWRIGSFVVACSHFNVDMATIEIEDILEVGLLSWEYDEFFFLLAGFYYDRGDVDQAWHYLQYVL